MSIAQAFAGAWFSCCIVMAVPALAASHVAGTDQGGVHSALLGVELGRAAALDRLSSDLLETMASKAISSSEDRLPAYADVISDLMRPPGQRRADAVSPRSRSAVPLPTGLSLFGAGLLTLGLVGFVSGGQRRLAVETGFLAEVEIGCDAAEAAPTTRFRIAVRNGQGQDVRHTVSARHTIDLIADLLNEGWEITSIRDRSEAPVDYEDILDAWHSERLGDRKGSAPPS